MKALKALLMQLLGRRQYLQLTSWFFLLSFRRGWLKNDPAYRVHYFVRQLVQPGHTVLDIGANLGYYATEFARLVGPQGRVVAVEPIPLYRSVLSRHLHGLSQCSILPYALGTAEGSISMGLPTADQHRHGLMKVLTEEEKSKAPEIIEVPVKHPVSLFEPLGRIDYIKCDIEGYEVPVIPTMRPLLEKQQPIVQVETDGDNKRILFDFFNELGYQLFYVGAQGLVPYRSAQQTLVGDLIAIPPHRLQSVQSFITE